MLLLALIGPPPIARSSCCRDASGEGNTVAVDLSLRIGNYYSSFYSLSHYPSITPIYYTAILGLSWDNGKENGNYYSIVFSSLSSLPEAETLSLHAN